MAGEEPVKPQPGARVKYTGDNGEGNKFPGLQGKTFSAKGSLTKSINALDVAVQSFNNIKEETPLISKERKARNLMEAVNLPWKKLMKIW